MGTSVNHPSPRTTGWTAVAAGYAHKEIPAARVATEIWRAARGEDGFSGALESSLLFKCYKAVQSATTAESAINSIRSTVLKDQNNTIVAELAVRAVPVAFSQPGTAHLSWRKHLFSQITDYFASRDASGYVGAGRFANVTELANFKKKVRQHVVNAVGTLANDPKTAKEWVSFVRQAVSKVTG